MLAGQRQLTLELTGSVCRQKKIRMSGFPELQVRLGESSISLGSRHWRDKDFYRGKKKKKKRVKQSASLL